MVDFQDPNVIARDYMVLTKLFHTMGGLYIWEFVTTLDYEWDVIQGRRPYRWTIWIYSFTRLATLMAVILTMVGLDATRPMNCQVWVTFTFIFYVGLATSILLIVLRIIAIWDKSKVVIALAAITWGVYLAFFIQAVFELHSTWSPQTGGCTPPTMERDKVPVTVMVCIDVALVVAMFIGLLRLRGRVGGLFGLVRLLWKQGVIWFLFATGAGITTVVFIWLDLNPIFNIMFAMPGLIIFAITATRMYTSLVDFASATDIVVESNLERRNRTVSSRGAQRVRMPVVHVTCEQYPTSQSGTLSLNMSEQKCDKPQELSLEDDPESGV